MDAFVDADVKSTAPACKHTGGLQLMSGGRELVPALGLAWANCINTRIFFSKTEYAVSTCCLSRAENSSLPQPATLPLRCMQVVFSPCLPQDSCLYIVSQSGLQGIDPAQLNDGDVQHYHQEQDCGTEQHHISHQRDAARAKQASMQRIAVPLQQAAQPDRTVLQPSTSVSLESKPTDYNSSRKQQTCTMATGVFASF